MSGNRPVAVALADCVERWWQKIRSNSGDCRVVLPAPTAMVAKELHLELMARRLPSYLVVGARSKSGRPSESLRILRAEAVTSVRDGSFVAVIEPGILSRLQESIQGSGGGIRSLAIPDEWPWAGADLGFDFYEDFFPNWVKSSGFPESEIGVAKGLLRLAIDSLEPIQGRSTLLFDDVLAQTFDVNEPEGLRSDQFAMALGVPSITAPSVGPVGIPEAALNDVVSAGEVERAMRGEAAREAVNQNAANALLELPEQDRPGLEEFKGLLNKALARLRTAKQRGRGPLALRPALPSDHGEWRLLTLEVLRRVFVQAGQLSAVELMVEWDAKSSLGYVAPGGRHCVASGYQLPGLNITVRRDTTLKAAVEIKVGRNLLRRESLSPGQDTIIVPLDGEELLSTSSAITVTAEVVSQPRASTKVYLERATDDSATFILALLHTRDLSGIKSVARFESAGGSEGEESIDLDRYTKILAVSRDTSPVLTLNGAATPVQVLATGVWWVDLDPAEIESCGVPPELSLTGGGDQVSVSLVADGGRPGACNLEVALLNSLQTRKSTREADSLLNAWIGEVDARSLLGTPSHAQEARFRLAKDAFESTKEPWLPVASSAEGSRISSLERRGWLRLSDSEDALRGSDLTADSPLSSTATSLIEAYSEAREELLGRFMDRHRGKALHGLPLYAAASFHYEDGDAFDLAIRSYLASFEKIQRLLGDGNLEYRDRFVLTYLDCAVSTSKQNGFWSVTGAALGPWHPLVIAKRMMVGRGLVRLASLSQRSDATWLRRLGVLLKDLPGFKWFAGLQSGSDQIVPFYVDATTDPGWLIAMPTTATSDGTPNQLLEWARDCLGLDVLRGSGAGAASFTGYLLDFTRAFPSKRAIVVKANYDAPAPELVAAARAFLTSDEGTITKQGSALRGGIHVVIDGDGGNPDDYPDWSEPVVSLYPRGGAKFVDQHKIDLSLMQPASSTQFAVLPGQGSGRASPRGRGIASILQLPDRALQQTGLGVMDTRLSYDAREPDDSEDIGGAFTRAIYEAQRAAGHVRAVTVRTIQAVQSANAATWTVIPGDSVDPAVLLEWARSSAAAGSPRVLWDYRMALTQSYRTYFVLSEIPQQLLKHVTASAVFSDEKRAGVALMELASIGLALGAEAFKSRSRALGVVGLIGSARVAMGILESAIGNLAPSCRFLLPVDSFQDLLGGDAEGSLNDAQADYRRSDLVGVVCRVSDGDVEIALCSIESKYSSDGFTESKARAALEQANKSLARLLDLSSAARLPNALAERVALARLIEFGLRLDKSVDSSVVNTILSTILRGTHRTSVLGATGCLVVSTEISLAHSCVTNLDEGVWVRLSPNHWPGESGGDEFLHVATDASSAMRPAWLERQEAMGNAEQEVAGQKPEDITLAIVPTPAGVTTSNSVAVTSPAESPVVSDNPTDGQALEAEPVVVPPHPDRESPATGAPVRILLGVGDDGKPVQWRAGENSNHNFMVTGSSGLGKTQLLKSILWQVRGAGLPALVLDFKNDFASDHEFLARANLDVQYVGFEGLPYNPLIPCPQPDPRTGARTYMLGQHVTGIVSAFQKTYGLGEQQAADLKESIRAALDEAGLPLTGVVNELPQAFPDFAEVGEHLKEKNRLAYNRLDPLFDLEIFREGYRATPFSQLLGRGVVLDLSGIQAEHIQNTLAALLVYSAHRYLNSLPHAPSINQVLVFDEAHRVLKSEDVGKLVRECRAYGLGVVLSSQYPTDFPPDTAANLATKVLHGNGPDVSRVQGIRSMLGLGAETESRLNLKMFNAVTMAKPGAITFARTLGYPHRVLLEAIRCGHSDKASLSQVKGIHADKFEQALAHLVDMGLVSTSGGQIRLNS